MRKAVSWAIVLTGIVISSADVPIGVLPDQGASAQSAEAALPPDVNPDSRNRLPPIGRDVEGAAVIRLDAAGNPHEFQPQNAKRCVYLSMTARRVSAGDRTSFQTT